MTSVIFKQSIFIWHYTSCKTVDSLTTYQLTLLADEVLAVFLVCFFLEYRIAGNFSEIETLTIFASRHENAKFSLQESGSNNNIVRAMSSANWSDRESMNREN